MIPRRRAKVKADKGYLMQLFGQKMRALRTHHGMTIRELAAALSYKGVGRISELESGKRVPTADFVFKVAKLFKVTTDQLLDDELELDIQDGGSDPTSTDDGS